MKKPTKYFKERRKALKYLNGNDWATHPWSEKAVKSFVMGMLTERKDCQEEIDLLRKTAENLADQNVELKKRLGIPLQENPLTTKERP